MPSMLNQTHSSIGNFEEALGADWNVASRLATINKTFCVLEMMPDGKIQHANFKFLSLMGYKMGDIKNRHHSMLCFDDMYAKGEYDDFWAQLRQGNFIDSKVLRRKADGGEVWLQAIYAPVLSPQGEVQRVLKIAIDITEAQNTKLEAQYQLEAIDRSTGIIEFDTDGTILAANPRLLQRFAYQPDEVIGKHHAMLCPDGYAQTEEYQLFWKALRDGQYQSGVFRRVSADGQRIWISASYNPILDARGRVSRIIKFAQDITERYESTLFSQQQIKALKSAQAVVEFDSAGIVIDASPVFLKRTGFTRSDVVGHHFAEIFFQPAAKGVAAPAGVLWQSLVSEKIQNLELQSTNRLGREVWWRASFTAIRDVDDNVSAISMVGFDTTEEKLAANALIARDAAMNTAFIRIDFDMDGSVQGMNDNAARFYGLNCPEEGVNTHHNKMLPSNSDMALAYNKLWARLRDGELVSGRFRRLTRDGREVWIEGAYSPILNLSGKPLRVMALGVDITEQMEIETHIADGISEITDAITRLASHVHSRQAQ